MLKLYGRIAVASTVRGDFFFSSSNAAIRRSCERRRGCDLGLQSEDVAASRGACLDVGQRRAADLRAEIPHLRVPIFGGGDTLDHLGRSPAQTTVETMQLV